MLQRLVVSGDLPCSKEEAALLAGIQLRIEETWPSAGRDADQRLKLRPITEDAKESTSECPDEKSGFNSAMSKSTAILRNWMGSNGSKDNNVLEDCVAPMYRTTKNMGKAIKEQKRKLFHSRVYENELHLKKLYIQNCKRLPAYGCRVYQVKERTKKRNYNFPTENVNRLLGIGVEKCVLLDSKSLLLTKSQFTCDLEQWRTGRALPRPDRARVPCHQVVLHRHLARRPALHQHGAVGGDAEPGRTLPRRPRHSLQAGHRQRNSQVPGPEAGSGASDGVQKGAGIPAEHAPLPGSGHPTPCREGIHENAVKSLVKRFQEVSSWVTHIIVSQPTHEDRKAVLSCILRVATTCWNLNNFNTAMEILAGLKSEKLKPFWLSLPEKDNISCLEMLTNALLTPKLSMEYCSAIEKAPLVSSKQSHTVLWDIPQGNQRYFERHAKSCCLSIWG
ncbi:hypothetical protein CEXT_403662 [Caerostris extrusa]|uniref:Ras-GEF domain-containing protein n=1 Tax=Caerostris extrusa TaxID=172846 RepID=A0AAV4N6X2_CAEEX|nr:hypothetical protein CEXT_403662 [Caerostris extrusa]